MQTFHYQLKSVEQHKTFCLENEFSRERRIERANERNASGQLHCVYNSNFFFLCLCVEETFFCSLAYYTVNLNYRQHLE